MAYDLLAPAYDLLTAGYCHDRWLEAILRVARIHGLRGNRALDVACGTGKSFLPLLARSYDVTACDISSRMVEIAREKSPSVEIFARDMRNLGAVGEFDLVTCLDDAVNYLLSVEDLGAFFAGVARNLDLSGVAVFDLNSLKLYGEDFGRDWTLADPDAFIAWTAPTAGDVPSSGRVAATVVVFARDGDSWIRRDSVHEQRHWPRQEIERAAGSAGLRVVAVYGQHRGARLDPAFSETEHHKGLYVVKHNERR